MCDDARANVLLVVLCGLPAAGKTTVSHGIQALAQEHDVTVQHVCLDSILEHNLPGAGGNSADGAATFTADAWQASRQQLLQHVEEQLAARQHVQQQQQCQRLLLLVDDINHYRSMRYEFVQLARQYQAAFLQVYLDCPLELALQRNSQRPAAALMPAAVLQRLAAAFEPPTPEKYAWEKATLVVDYSNNTAAAEHAEPCWLWSQLLARWGAPLAPPPTEEELAAQRAAGSAANAASQLHRLDLDTRRLLGETVGRLHKDVRADASTQLNAKRKQLIEQLRAHHSVAGPGADGLREQLLESFKQLCDSYTASAEGKQQDK